VGDALVSRNSRLDAVKVLLVNNYAHVTGGADLYCLEITRGLRERGHEVRWLATRAPENEERSGAFVSRLVGAENRDDLSFGARARVVEKAIWNREAGRSMGELARSFRPDVVHVHKAYVQLSVAPVVVAARAGLPVVQTVHDYEFVSASPLDSSGRRWDHDESRLSYRALNSATFISRRRVHRPRVTRWIAVSRAVARIYDSAAGIGCEVIPNFVPESTAPALPLEARGGVLFLGRLSREKGIYDVIEAARRLPGTNFTVAGDGPMREEVVAAAATLPNLDYLGFVSGGDARDLIREAVACLMPSRWQEPGPLACLESMAEGTPVICFPNGGLAEYVADSSAGLVCGNSDPGDLVEAIERLVADPAEWKRLSANGPAGIAGRHSRAVHLDRLLGVYESANGR